MVIALVRKYRGETTSSNKQLLVLSWLKYPCVETSLSHEESQCFSSWTVDTWAKMSRFFASTKRLQKTLGFSLHSKCKLHLHCICFGPCRNAALFSRAGMGSWLQWPSCPAVLHFRSRPLMPWGFFGRWDLNSIQSVTISYINKPFANRNFTAKNTSSKNMIFLYMIFCFCWTNQPFLPSHFPYRTSRPWPVPRTMPWRWSLRASVAPWICDASRRCNENWTMPSMTWASAPLCVWIISHPRT